MTSTRERRTEYSTSSNVVRVLSPTRPLSPQTPTNEYDNNLEYLLDDLQHSISRPGSSLGQNAPGSTAYTTTTRDVQYLSPSNTSTMVRERSRSPTSDAQRVYKTYEYSTSGQGLPSEMQQNIHQLDTLLSDLNSDRERERDLSIDRRNTKTTTTRTSSSNLGIDPGLLEDVPVVKPGGTTKIIKETTYSTDYSGQKPGTPRELVFDSPENRQSRPRQRSPEQNYYKTVEKTVTTTRDGSYPGNDTGLYGGINRTTPRPDRTLSPPQTDKYATNSTKVYNYSSTNKTSEDVIPSNVPYNEIVRVEDLKDLSTLSEDLLPKPSTKVTTTVRTYTYEIPAEPATTTIVYNNDTYDSRTINNQPPQHIHPNPPTNETYIYKNEKHTTNTVDYPGGPDGGPKYPRERPTSPVIQPGTNKTIIYKTDTRETTTNQYPKNREYPVVEYPPDTPPQQPRSQPPPTNTTIIYKENITDRNRHIHHPPPAGGVPVYPPAGSSPPQPGPKSTYYYKHESTNTTNTQYGPPGSASPYPNDKYPKNANPQPIEHYPQNHPGNPGWAPPPQSTTVNYKYTTNTNTSTRNAYPPGPEKEPLLQPTPFPVEGYGPSDYPDGPQNPPKRLDDLMATFGDNSRNPPYPNGQYVAEKPLQANAHTYNSQQVVKPTATIEPKPSAKNIGGPAVYYPPGHELFAKNEQSQSMGAYRSQGGYAKGSGKYMYEAESRSKSKSSSGATVVPVCLPLCCGLPCVIM